MTQLEKIATKFLPLIFIFKNSCYCLIFFAKFSYKKSFDDNIVGLYMTLDNSKHKIVNVNYLKKPPPAPLFEKKIWETKLCKNARTTIFAVLIPL